MFPTSLPTLENMEKQWKETMFPSLQKNLVPSSYMICKFLKLRTLGRFAIDIYLKTKTEALQLLKTHWQGYTDFLS
jgi:hypothetical protein